MRGHELTVTDLSSKSVERAELEEVLREADFGDIIWHMPADSGYYQPIITAQRQG